MFLLLYFFLLAKRNLPLGSDGNLSFVRANCLANCLLIKLRCNAALLQRATISDWLAAELSRQLLLLPTGRNALAWRAIHAHTYAARGANMNGAIIKRPPLTFTSLRSLALISHARACSLTDSLPPWRPERTSSRRISECRWDKSP